MKLPKSQKKFIRWLKKITKGIVPWDYSKGPYGYYNNIGGYYTISTKDCDYYAEWINHDVSILRSQKTDEVIGCSISDPDNKKVLKIFKKFKFPEVLLTHARKVRKQLQITH